MDAAHTPDEVSVYGASRGPDSLRRCVEDLREAIGDWRLWTFLAHHEIRARYRRSTIGPLWLTLSLAIQVAAMGVVWGTLFQLDAKSFIPYLTLGLLVWGLIIGIIGEGAQCFVSAAGYVTHTKRALSTYVFLLVSRNVLVSAHTFLVYIGAALFFQVPFSSATLLALPGFAIFVLALAWTPLVLGPLGARFRDIPQVVQSALMVTFFVTPVMWRADMLGTRAYLATLNPLSHLIEIVRAPLLGQAPSALSWAVAIGVALFGWAAALLIFARVRARIPYWL